MNMCAATTMLDSHGNTLDTMPYGVSATATPMSGAWRLPGSLAPVPWVSLPTAQVLIEMHNFDGSLYPRDPRNVLRRGHAAAAATWACGR